VAVILSVLSSLMVGVILVVAPWTALWETNYLLHPYPALRALLANAFVRGTVSGLGLVNLVLAVQEAADHLRHRRG
jgi:hypothetical protein